MEKQGYWGRIPEDEVIASRGIDRHGIIESIKGFLRGGNIEAREMGDHGGRGAHNGIIGIKVLGVIEGDRGMGGNEITRWLGITRVIGVKEDYKGKQCSWSFGKMEVIPIKSTWNGEELVDMNSWVDGNQRWRSRGQGAPKRKFTKRRWSFRTEGRHQSPGGSGVRKRSRAYTSAQSPRAWE